MTAQAQKATCDSYLAYLVDKAVPLTGESLAGADASRSQNTNDFEVNLSFDAQGGIEFGKLTEENVGRRMAIVLDDNVNSAPRINEQIPNGRARITMGRTAGKTRRADVPGGEEPRAGAPAPARCPRRSPSARSARSARALGEELIRKGSLAALVGLALVVVFMAVYYRKSGLIADVALILNGLLILAGLALFNATLTLPGIAGFVLTLGIAVDANVLINERVREELAAGKSRSRRGGPGLRPGVLDHLRRPRHHAHRRVHPALHGDRSGARVRHLADHRAGGLALHLDRRDPGRSPPTSSTGATPRSRSDDADHQAQDEHRLHRQAEARAVHLARC